MSAAPPEHRHLRSALEFAVEVAREASKRRPPLAVPADVKKFMKMQRVPSAALGQLRRVLEREDEFRQLVGSAATPEFMDEIGLLWLQRPEGWVDSIDELVAAVAAEAERAGAEAELRRERRRREAAEQVTARTRLEVVALEEQVRGLAAELAEARDLAATLRGEVSDLREQLTAARTDVRHANDRAEGVARKLQRLEAELAGAEEARAEAVHVRDEVLADRADEGVEAARLADLATQARHLATSLAALVAPIDGAAVVAGAHGGDRPDRRRPLALPGGVLGSSDVAAEHLLRSGATILIDGYNVSMLGWPELAIAAQRGALVDLVEAVARRYGADLTVVFDGADVVGASADHRRVARVMFSPPDVIADDVIRSEVVRLPASRPVVVVTNDAEIVRDVRAMGANTMPSDAFVRVARR